MEYKVFYPGDIVSILDKIDGESTIIATVRAIEADDEIDGLYWLYLIANESILNDKFDNKIGNFWTIIESNSPYITLISRAVN